MPLLFILTLNSAGVVNRLEPGYHRSGWWARKYCRHGVRGRSVTLVIGKFLDVTGGDWLGAFMASIAVMILSPIGPFLIRLDRH